MALTLSRWMNRYQFTFLFVHFSTFYSIFNLFDQFFFFNCYKSIDYLTVLDWSDWYEYLDRVGFLKASLIRPCRLLCPTTSATFGATPKFCAKRADFETSLFLRLYVICFYSPFSLLNCPASCVIGFCATLPSKTHSKATKLNWKLNFFFFVLSVSICVYHLLPFSSCLEKKTLQYSFRSKHCRKMD